MAEVKLNGVNNSEASKRHELVQKETASSESALVPIDSETKKQSAVLNFIDKFGLNWDPIGAMGTVFEEVIAPTIIDGLRDSIYTATDYILYGGRRSSSGSRAGGGRSGYREKSMQKAKKVKPADSGYNITWTDENGGRAEAERVLREIRDVIADREYVTIMEMITIAKRKSTNFMYNDWGWYDLRTAMVRRNVADDYYYIDLPKPVAIEG